MMDLYNNMFVYGSLFCSSLINEIFNPNIEWLIVTIASLTSLILYWIILFAIQKNNYILDFNSELEVRSKNN